ncbi:MAG: 2-C-methyl-D-erythritol 2,4-cyclodiphosphate synthase, partial [Tidjanibacter sp.]|nr:2-C-methyl-D-erythritol 2,4-cyclodiphosphate synthase [Tidjanibacter sp.]
MFPLRVGHGYDVHALEEGLLLRIGGVDIPHTHGFVAHSDGDVLIHALCDALLGA